MEERFEYDDMNRLTGITLKRPSGQDLYCSATYEAFGRMTSKEAVTKVNSVPQVTTVFSLPVFDNTKVHALSQAQTSEGVFPSTDQTVTYTGFDKVSVVRQGKDSICYSYGNDHQRIFMEEHVGSTTRTKRYVGNCEYVTRTTGGNTETQWLTYLSGPTGVFAVMAMEGDDAKTHYILKDNLGSWTTITDEDGLVEQNLSYDAWGNLRNPQTWANYTTDDTFDKPLFDRGYTGHKHLNNFGLINMNGRMYDPVTSTFLSVDNFVQDPSSTQSFNRYAYCMNNPLKYTDPDGEFFITFGLSFDKEHGISGFSLGLNFGLFGFGINSNWSNGFSLGAYAEVGPRIGNAGFTASIGVDYNFDYETTTASASAGYGFSYGIGRVGIGVGGSYTWGLSSKINPWNSNASVGLGLVGNISQFGQMAGFGLSCSYGTQGWNYGTHGFCEMLPLQEKLNRIVDYYKTELSEAIGNTNAKVLVGNNSNFRKNGVNACNIYGDIWDRSEKKYANGITIPGKAVGLVEFDEQKYVSLDSYIYLSKNTIKKIWNNNESGKRTLFHEWVHAYDYYCGQADSWFKQSYYDYNFLKIRMEQHAHDFVNEYFTNLPPIYYQP